MSHLKTNNKDEHQRITDNVKNKIECQFLNYINTASFVNFLRQSNIDTVDFVIQ